jgi:hypothetical protein
MHHDAAARRQADGLEFKKRRVGRGKEIEIRSRTGRASQIGQHYFTDGRP